MYRDYTDEKLQAAIAESFSTAGVLRLLGLKPAGGNYNTVRTFIEKNNINISHWTGKGWSKGKHVKQIGGYSKPYKIKAALAALRGWECEICGLSEWLNKKIPLEIHHIDFDRTHNVESNFLLCCRNCHFAIHDRT